MSSLVCEMVWGLEPHYVMSYQCGPYIAFRCSEYILSSDWLKLCRLKQKLLTGGPVVPRCPGKPRGPGGP